MRDFLERRRRYVNLKTKKTSFNIVDVLPRRLTLNMQYVNNKMAQGRAGGYFWKWHHRQSNHHLFNEVELMPPVHEVTHRALPERGTSSIVVLLKTLEMVAKRNWRPGKCKVIMHSSGYDSRLFSAILRKMWIRGEIKGKLLFICTKNEGGPFKQIMEFEGWRPSQYVVYHEAVPDLEYFAPSLEDFKGAWRRLGGVSRVPANLFWYTVEGLQAEGRLPGPGHIDMWYTQYADTVLSHLGAGSVHHFNKLWREFYYHVIRTRPFKCTSEFCPWLNWSVMRSVAGLARKDIPQEGLDAPTFKKQLCDMVLPGLSRFTNVHLMGDEQMNISPRLRKLVKSQYLESWYGKHIAPHAGDGFNCNTRFHDFWEHWSSASLCEYLLKRGYAIK